MSKVVAKLSGLLLIGATSLCMNSLVRASTPNVIVFLVDDMGIMDTSVPFLSNETGKPKSYPLNNFYRTPNMERLAAKGTRLNNFYAMSVCSPTRVSIMTGRNASRHRTTNWINPTNNNGGPFGPTSWNWLGLQRSDVTLPSLLAKAGYRTIHIGKGHFGPRNSEGSEPLNLGFEINVAGHSAGRPASYYGLDGFGKNNKTHGVPGLDEYHGKDIYLTEALTLEAKKKIAESVEAKQPFYLYMSHYAVHAPFQMDKRYRDNYVDSGKSQKAQAFATMIEGMDKSLGDLLDHVLKLGVANETLVLFMGDNGTDAPLGGPHEIACAAPLRGKKGSHYEGGMRVPFIASWAKPDSTSPCQARLPIASGELREHVASVCDVLPTVLSAAQVVLSGEYTIDGSPLDAILAGAESPSRDFLMHYPHGRHRSNYFTIYRSEDWKVIYHWHPEMNPQRKRYELFNLADDQSESTDLATTHREELFEMIGKMAEQLRSHGALYPIHEKSKQPLQIELPDFG